ncbi:hypothetical protein ACEE90_10285, partial [Corynebacterium phoceense]
SPPLQSPQRMLSDHRNHTFHLSCQTGVYPLARHLWNTPSNAPKIVVPEMSNREAELSAQIDRFSSKFGNSTRTRYSSDRRKEKEAS